MFLGVQVTVLIRKIDLSAMIVYEAINHVLMSMLVYEVTLLAL